MKLDRNVKENAGRNKYALIKLREYDKFRRESSGLDWMGLQRAIKTLEDAGLIDWGEAHTVSEFFVIKLRDQYAQDALCSYSRAAEKDDYEYAEQVWELSDRAGPDNNWCKIPD